MNKYSIPILSKKCLVCGSIFYKSYNRSRRFWEIQKYCSVKCSLEKTAISKQDHSHNPARQKGKIPWNKGVSYGEDMKSRLNLSGLEKGRGFMRGKHFPQMQGENSPRWKGGPQKVPCVHCKKELSLAKWQIRERNFCNRQCWALGTRGKGSPVFLGEKATSLLRTRISTLDEHKAWHRAILERDNYTCQICGKRGGILEVDHIKRYMLIAQENNIKTLEDARNCKELWDLKNGRTLCKECHRKSDTFGTRGLKNRKYKPNNKNL